MAKNLLGFVIIYLIFRMIDYVYKKIKNFIFMMIRKKQFEKVLKKYGDSNVGS